MRCLTCHWLELGCTIQAAKLNSCALALCLFAQELDALPDPCPVPGSGSTRRRGLNDKDRTL